MLHMYNYYICAYSPPQLCSYCAVWKFQCHKSLMRVSPDQFPIFEGGVRQCWTRYHANKLITPRAHAQKGISNCVFCLSVCLSVGLSVNKEILTRLKYADIRSEKRTITMFTLFWIYSADSTIYELQIPSFLIS